MNEDFESAEKEENRITMREILESGHPVPAMAIPWAPDLLAIPGRDLNDLVLLAKEGMESKHDDPDLRLHALQSAISHLSLLSEDDRAGFDLVGHAEAAYLFLRGGA